ncbi:glycosyltransferase [Shewanella glacialipiscicola]|uniref:glycosyltransferase n=1 Tax=Shewanella glacialipiscicola TaxID=614069 RepID=UPI003D79BD7E
MKIVIQEPVFLLSNQKCNFNAYNYSFLVNYATGIFTRSKKKLAAYIAALSFHGINPLRFNFYLDESELSNIDILICFNGKPYEKLNKMPKVGSFLKIMHIMDYADEPMLSNESLRDHKVDLLMGYTDHSKYCSFFKYHYDYEAKVISVPFGAGKRFYKQEFQMRYNKVLAIGAINDISNGTSCVSTFFPNEKYSHPIRDYIRSHAHNYKFISSLLPTEREEKNKNIDMCRELQSYNFFVNDLSIFNFPPARTYEGIAAGSILVGNKSPVYEELGFVDGTNCILIDSIECNDGIELLANRISNIDINLIRHNSKILSERYTHDKIAERLNQYIMSEIL